MRKIFFILFLGALTMNQTLAEPKVKPKVIIKYKQYESFDLGNLEIKGKIIAPGDLSVKERQRKRFSRPLFERDEFDPEVREDIQNLR